MKQSSQETFNNRSGNKIMKDSKKNVAVQIAIRKEDKYLLKKIVAKKILENPDKNFSLAKICKEIISQYLKEQQNETNI